MNQPTREIVYSPEDRDFALYLNGELVGFARSYADGERVLDELVYARLTKASAVPAEELSELALEDRAAGYDAAAALAEMYCETCGTFDDAGRERCPRCGDAALPPTSAPDHYARLEGSVYDLAAGRFYCTLAAWPHSPAARAGAALGELAA